MTPALLVAQLTLDDPSDRQTVKAWAAAETALGDGGVARLYQATDGTPSYALVQAMSVSRLEAALSAPCLIQATRYVGVLASDDGLMENPHTIIQVVAFDVPEPLRTDVDAWYREEHIGLLLQATGWLRARRMVVAGYVGRPFTSIAVHELSDLSVMDSPARTAARSTPWRATFSSQAWFEGSGRWLYRRLEDL